MDGVAGAAACSRALDDLATTVTGWLVKRSSSPSGTGSWPVLARGRVSEPRRSAPPALPELGRSGPRPPWSTARYASEARVGSSDWYPGLKPAASAETYTRLAGARDSGGRGRSRLKWNTPRSPAPLSVSVASRRPWASRKVRWQLRAEYTRTAFGSLVGVGRNWRIGCADGVSNGTSSPAASSPLPMMPLTTRSSRLGLRLKNTFCAPRAVRAGTSHGWRSPSGPTSSSWPAHCQHEHSGNHVRPHLVRGPHPTSGAGGTTAALFPFHLFLQPVAEEKARQTVSCTLAP
jgi:hypothetical protein